MPCDDCNNVPFLFQELKDIILQLADRFDRQESYVQRISTKLDDLIVSFQKSQKQAQVYAGAAGKGGRLVGQRSSVPLTSNRFRPILPQPAVQANTLQRIATANALRQAQLTSARKARASVLENVIQSKFNQTKNHSDSSPLTLPMYGGTSNDQQSTLNEPKQVSGTAGESSIPLTTTGINRRKLRRPFQSVATPKTNYSLSVTPLPLEDTINDECMKTEPDEYDEDDCRLTIEFAEDNNANNPSSVNSGSADGAESDDATSYFTAMKSFVASSLCAEEKGGSDVNFNLQDYQLKFEEGTDEGYAHTAEDGNVLCDEGDGGQVSYMNEEDEELDAYAVSANHLTNGGSSEADDVNYGCCSEDDSSSLMQSFNEHLILGSNATLPSDNDNSHLFLMTENDEHHKLNGISKTSKRVPYISPRHFPRGAASENQATAANSSTHGAQSPGDSTNLICNVCQKAFGSKATYKRHMETVHSRIRYKCPNCPFESKRRDYLYVHLRMNSCQRWEKGTRGKPENLVL